MTGVGPRIVIIIYAVYIFIFIVAILGDCSLFSSEIMHILLCSIFLKRDFPIEFSYNFFRVVECLLEQLRFEPKLRILQILLNSGLCLAKWYWLWCFTTFVHLLKGFSWDQIFGFLSESW